MPTKLAAFVRISRHLDPLPAQFQMYPGAAKASRFEANGSKISEARSRGVNQMSYRGQRRKFVELCLPWQRIIAVEQVGLICVECHSCRPLIGRVILDPAISPMESDTGSIRTPNHRPGLEWGRPCPIIHSVISKPCSYTRVQTENAVTV